MPATAARDFKVAPPGSLAGQPAARSSYTVIAEHGPDHDKTFEVAISLGDKEYGRAQGKSKKEAQQNAAERALAALAD